MLYLLYMDMPILVEIPEIWFHELCMLFCIKTLRSKIRKERYKNDHQTPSLLGKQKAIPIFLGVLLLLHGKLSYDTVCGSGRSTDRSVMIQSFTSHAPIGAIVINWSFACSTLFKCRWILFIWIETNLTNPYSSFEVTYWFVIWNYGICSVNSGWLIINILWSLEK